MHLKGKAGIVTGGGRGIGRDIALLMAKHGASVVVCDPGAGRNGEVTGERPADEVVDEIRAAGGKAQANYDSVADYQKAGAMVRKCVEDYGKIDFVVNPAGVLRERMIWNMSEEDFDLVISVHLKGHWNMCHHATKYMRQVGFGRIVNFSSDAFKGSIGQCNYAAAKAGIIGLTRSIAKEAYKFGITANAMCPYADTRMTVNEGVTINRKRKLDQGLITQAEFDRASQLRGPEHIAPMVAYLCTDQAYYINGQIFHAEKGRISTYLYGDDHKFMYKHEDEGLFTLDELIAQVPASLMSGIVPVVPAVKVADAMKASDMKKAAS